MLPGSVSQSYPEAFLKATRKLFSTALVLLCPCLHLLACPPSLDSTHTSFLFSPCVPQHTDLTLELCSPCHQMHAAGRALHPKQLPVQVFAFDTATALSRHHVKKQKSCPFLSFMLLKHASCRDMVGVVVVVGKHQMLCGFGLLSLVCQVFEGCACHG